MNGCPWRRPGTCSTNARSTPTKSLRKTATNFRNALETPPPVLVVDRYRTELDKVRSTAKALNARLQEPLVEDLRALEHETDHLVKVVLDAAGRYDIDYPARWTSLDRALLELDAQLKTANARLAEPEKLQVYPLDWDVSRPALIGLERKAPHWATARRSAPPNRPPPRSPRPPRSSNRSKPSPPAPNRPSWRHHELLSLLGTGAIANGAAFTAEAAALSRTVQAYDPANWANQDNLASLPKEAAQLEDLQRRLTAVEQPAQVKESDCQRPPAGSAPPGRTAHRAALARRPRAEAAWTSCTRWKTTCRTSCSAPPPPWITWPCCSRITPSCRRPPPPSSTACATRLPAWRRN